MTDGAWRIGPLTVGDLRCWHRARVELPPGLVVLAGPNGAGKTSLVEAVVLAAVGASPRSAKLSELIRQGAPALHVSAGLTAPDSRGGITTRRDIGYAARTGRRLAEDGEPVRTLASWRRPGAVLVFVPEELRAVKGPPAARRRALDRLLEAVVPGFAPAAGEYADAVAQRNALLRRARSSGADPGMVAAAAGPWEAAAARAGALVQCARRAMVERLREPFARRLASLGGGEGGRLALESSPSRLADVPDDLIEAALRDNLHQNRGRDLAAGMTLGGPHRDDLWIGRDDHDIRRFGSQGEQRTAALALLLAHRDVLDVAAARPILLLDDVLSELDPARRRALVEAVADGGQAVITTADPDVPRSAGAGDATLIRVPEDVDGR